MKKHLSVIIVLLLFFMIATPLRMAHADYVLPYPSYMPGNKLYRVMRIVDQLKRFWYWGNIAQTKYHLELSDKYLVEAKTLMEYNQYLLATDALSRSNKEFMQLPKYINGVAKEGVDTKSLKQLVVSAADKHVEVLNNLLLLTPDTVVWSPEKAASTTVTLHHDIQNSLQIVSQVRIDISP